MGTNSLVPEDDHPTADQPTGDDPTGSSPSPRGGQTMTYPPDTPPATYRPDAGSAYLADDPPGPVAGQTSPYVDRQSAYSSPLSSDGGSSDGGSPDAGSPDAGSAGSSPSTTQVAKDQAGEVGGTAAEAGQQVAGVAKEQAANVAGQAKYEAKNLMGQTREELTSQAGAQQQRAAFGLRSLGNELQSMSSNSDGDGPATEAARQAAVRINSAASWLEAREPGQVLSEVQRFARQRPGAFLGLAAAAGLLAGRLTRGLTAGDSSGDSQHVPPTADTGNLGAGTYGTESYGNSPAGSQPYGSQPYGTGVGQAAPADAPVSPPPPPPAAWEQDPIPPVGVEGYGRPAPGSGEVGR